MEMGTVGVRDYSVPNASQHELLTSMGIDPAQYAVSLSNEYSIHLLHYKTRNEVSIYINRRATNDNQREGAS